MKKISLIMKLIELSLLVTVAYALRSVHSWNGKSLELQRQPIDANQDLFIFVTPPASFMYHHISLVVELWKRQVGNILVLTLTGFAKAFEEQARAVELTDDGNSKIIIWNVGDIPSFQHPAGIRKGPLPMENATINKWGMPVSPFGSVAQLDSYTHLFMAIQESFLAALSECDPPLHLFCQNSENPSCADALITEGPYDEQVHQIADLFKQARRRLFIIPGILPTTMAFVHQLNVPYVNTIPTAVWADMMQPRMFSPYHHSVEMRDSFIQRLVDFTRSVYMKFFLNDNPLGFPSVRTKGLTLIFSHPFLASPRTLPPGIVFTGAVVSSEREDPKHISSQSLEVFEAGFPVVYVSFGTYAVLDDETFTMVAKAVLPDLEDDTHTWSVVWSLAARQRANLSQETLENYATSKPGRIAFEEWTMTPAILSNPSVQLFVSHCGGNSLGEAVRAGKPVLGLPAMAEQPWNCAVASRNMPFVSCHSLWNTSTEEIRSTLERVLFDEKDTSRKAAERLRLLSRRIFPGAPSAADWLEFAISGFSENTKPLITRDERIGRVKANYLDLIGGGAILAGFMIAIFGYAAGRISDRIEIQRKSLLF